MFCMSEDFSVLLIPRYTYALLFWRFFVCLFFCLFILQVLFVCLDSTTVSVCNMLSFGHHMKVERLQMGLLHRH